MCFTKANCLSIISIISFHKFLRQNERLSRVPVTTTAKEEVAHRHQKINNCDCYLNRERDFNSEMMMRFR